MLRSFSGRIPWADPVDPYERNPSWLTLPTPPRPSHPVLLICSMTFVNRREPDSMRAAEALRAFRRTVDEALPNALQPLRDKLIMAAVELADSLAATQYEFNRNLIRSADRALSKSESESR